MGDRSNSTQQDRALTLEDDITVVLQKVSRNSSDSDGDHNEGELTAERIHLREHDDADAEGTRREADGDSLSDERRTRPCCPRVFHVRGEPASAHEGSTSTQNES